MLLKRRNVRQRDVLYQIAIGSYLRFYWLKYTDFNDEKVKYRLQVVCRLKRVLIQNNSHQIAVRNQLVFMGEIQRPD